MQASATGTCHNGRVISASTGGGSKEARCDLVRYPPSSGVTGTSHVKCYDEAGNTATASCDGTCSSTGSGSCTVSK